MDKVALKSMDLNTEDTLDFKQPRKSILKFRENATVPLATSTQESSVRYDRRVSFADKVKLHKIDLVPVTGRSVSESSDVSEPESSDVENREPENSQESANEVVEGSVSVDSKVDPETSNEISASGSEGPIEEVSETTSLSNEAANDNNGDQETVPQLSDSDDDEYADADEKTMELTGQIALASQQLRLSGAGNPDSAGSSPRQPTGSFQLQISESPTGSESPEPAPLAPDQASAADVAFSHISEQPSSDEEQEMEFTGQISRDKEELTMDLTAIQPSNTHEQSKPQEQPENSKPSQSDEDHGAGDTNDNEQLSEPLQPEQQTSESQQQTSESQQEEEAQFTQLQPEAEEAMDLTEQIKPSNDTSHVSEEATMDFTKPFEAATDQAKEQSNQSDDDEPDDSTYRDLFLDETPMELTQPIVANVGSESKIPATPELSEAVADDTYDRIQVPEVQVSSPSSGTPDETSDKTQTEPAEHKEPDVSEEEVRSVDHESDDQTSRSVENQDEPITDSGSTESDTESRKRELGPAIDFSPPKRHHAFVTQVSTSTVPLADVSMTSIDDKDSEWDGPNVSLTDFLSEIGIKFYDDLEIATDLPNRFRPSESDGDVNYPKEDYYRANIHLPLLEVYELSCKELSGKIQQGKILFDELKEKTLQDNPSSFKQYFMAPFYEKMAMKSKFHLMKEYTRQQAKQVWYEWRIKLIGNIYDVFQSNLEILNDDKAVLEGNLQQLHRTFSLLKKKLTTLRQDISSFKEIKSNFEGHDVEQIRVIKSRLTELNQELLKHKDLISKKEEEVKAIETIARERSDALGLLKKEILEVEEKLNRTRHFDTNEINALEYISQVLQVCAGLKYVGNPSPSIYEFQFTSQMGITIDSSKPESADGIKFHPLSSASVLHNNELSQTYGQYLAETTSFVNVFDTLRKYREKWMKLVAIDEEIYRISLLHPVSIDLTDVNTLKFTVHYFNFSSKAKAELVVSLDMSKILDFANCITVRARLLRDGGDRDFKASVLDKAFSGTMLSQVRDIQIIS